MPQGYVDGQAIDSENAKRVLGGSPRSNEEQSVATAESLVRFRLLKHARNHS
jgi:hypothetical protein